MAKTIAELDAVQVVHGSRLDRLEEDAKTHAAELTKLQLRHEREIAVLTEQLAASRAETAILRARSEQTENRFWTLLSTTVFAALSGLIAVLVAVIKK